jgi:riboflavin kinase/FMN adenylyltransferase
VIVARSVEELPARTRTVAIGSFDGVHRGHRLVLDTARAAGATTTAVTFWPHPRLVLGNRVELLSTLERRLELLEAEGSVDEVLLVEFTAEVAALPAEQFAESVLRRAGATVIVVGENFRFGRGAAGDAGLLERLEFDVRLVPTLEGVSSTRIRGLLRDGDVEAAAQLLGRPAELDGTVVLGDQRGGTLGYPTANLAVLPDLLVPAYGIYAGLARGHRAAVSIGVNPHYGGDERRIEPHLLDFEGDLYGQRLVVELWQRLREERAFSSEEELVAQIARDVEATRAAERPVEAQTAPPAGS